MEFDAQKWIRTLDLKNSLLESATVKVVQVDSKGKILIGTNGVDVFKYDPVLNSPIDLKLGKINVHLIKEISDESIWIGTDNGLHQHNGVKWLHTQYTKTDLKHSSPPLLKRRRTEFGLVAKVDFFTSMVGLRRKNRIYENCVVELYDNIIMVSGTTGLYVLSKE